MPAINRIRRRDLLTLALILLVAAILRLGEPGIIEYKSDAANLTRAAQDVVFGVEFPLTGIQASIRLPNSPVPVYFVAIPFFIRNDPVFATMFIAAWNVVGVGLLWWLAYRYFSSAAALFAGLAYAVNPWALIYSRHIWAQDFHTPFLLIALLLGLMGFVEGKRWTQALYLPVLSIAFQIHFSGWALVPLSLWIMWMGRRRIAWRMIGLGIVLAVATLLPFAFGFAQSLLINPAPIEFIRERSSSIAYTLTIAPWRALAWLATGLGLEAQVAPQDAAFMLANVPPPAPLWLLLGALALVGAGVVWTRYRNTLVFFTLWILPPAILLSVSWYTAYAHYFVPQIAALSLLAGIGMTWLISRSPALPISRAALLAVFGMIVITQALWWRGLLRFMDTHALDVFHIALHHRLELAELLAPYDDVIVQVEDAQFGPNRETIVWFTLLREPGRCVRMMDTGNAAVLPDGEFAVLSPPNLPPMPVDAVYRAGREVMTYHMQPTNEDFIINVFDHAPEVETPPMRAIASARFASGVQLTGVGREGNRVWLEWRVQPQPGRPRNHRYTLQALDGDGEILGEHVERLTSWRYWCEGDRLLTWATLDSLENAAGLRVRLEIQNLFREWSDVPVVDEDERAISTWVNVPLSGLE